MITKGNKSIKELKYLVIKGIRAEVERYWSCNSDTDDESDYENLNIFREFCIYGSKLLNPESNYDFPLADEYYFKDNINCLISAIKISDDIQFLKLLDAYNDCLFKTA